MIQSSKVKHNREITREKTNKVAEITEEKEEEVVQAAVVVVVEVEMKGGIINDIRITIATEEVVLADNYSLLT